MAHDNIALLPLRGGSKSIRKKNIKLIAGKALCAWALEAAIASGIFSEVVVSTDSNEIADVVNKLQLGVRIIERPAHLATDTAPTESVMLHAVENLDFNMLTTIQATSPLVLPDDFTLAYKKMCEENLDSIVTGVRTKRFYWEDNGKPLNYDPQQRPRRQDFHGIIMENGAFYMTKRSILEKYKCRLGGKIGVYEMHADSAVEIDRAEDWCKVEELLKRRKWKSDFVGNCFSNANIDLVVYDFDGVMTDNRAIVFQDGTEAVTVNRADGLGIERIRKSGIPQLVLSTERNPVVKARAAKLRLEVIASCKDKKHTLENYCAQNGYDLDKVIYIGNDLNDLEVMRIVGFPVAPADAHLEIKKVAKLTTTAKGGEGVVKELSGCMVIS